MTINFLSYLDPFKYKGGGEFALRTVIERGRQRGHGIRVFARRTGKLSKLISPSFNLPPADLYFLADLFNCPEDPCKLDTALLERVIATERYVHFNNSYVDVCRRPALPCEGRRTHCPDDCGVERYRRLSRRSIANIFVSPLHERVVSSLLGGPSIPNALIARPFVSVDLFRNVHQRRDIPYLYVGVISNYKGYENLKRRFSGEDILLIGRNATTEQLIGRHIPYVPQKDLPSYYNRAEHLVHLPEWPEPQGRCVVEAALCGCKLITNDKVGATTFDFDISDPKVIGDAPDHLWRELERRCATETGGSTRDAGPSAATRAL